MWVLLLLCLAFELGAEGFEQRLVLRFESVGDRAQSSLFAGAVARMDQLLHDYCRDEELAVRLYRLPIFDFISVCAELAAWRGAGLRIEHWHSADTRR